MSTGAVRGDWGLGLGYFERALLFISMACGLLYLATQGLRPYSGSVVVKQLAIFPLALLALRALRSADGVLLGMALAFSGLGDMFLGIEGANLFVYGLGSFLIAHLFYLALFTRTVPRPLDLRAGRKALIFILLIYSAAMTMWLGPDLGPLAMPVIFYLSAITAMCLTAVLAGFRTPLVAAGAVLFVISDSLIAVNRFKMPIDHSDYLVWSTYYFGQLAIAWGVLREKMGPGG
ncbi:MAG TPA: lysoplasmalogenase [Blastocatellia bacterium]|nr:lysoplasmalogenase [Blastocatellia bacterium]